LEGEGEVKGMFRMKKKKEKGRKKRLFLGRSFPRKGKGRKTRKGRRPGE